jgi:hypothetical protein
VLLTDGEGLTAADWAAAGEHRSIEKTLVSAMGKAERAARAVPRGDSDGDSKRWSLWGRSGREGLKSPSSSRSSRFSFGSPRS